MRPPASLTETFETTRRAFSEGSNASTGFSWLLASIDAGHLMRVGHGIHASPAVHVGAAGTETWSFRVVAAGTGRATLVYSQPWRGGEKAAWTLMLTIRTA